MNRMDGKICVVTGGDAGARRGHRSPLRASRRRRHRHPAAATRAKGGPSPTAISRDTGVPVAFRPRRPRQRRRLPQRPSPKPTGLRHGSHVLVNAAGMTDRGTHPRHLARALRRDVRRQRARTVLPDAGGDQADDPRRRRGLDRQHRLDLRARRPAVHQPLLRLQGRADDADAQHRLLGHGATASASISSTSAGWPPTTSATCRRESRRPGLGGEGAAALPFGRLVDPEEAARAVAFLASDDAGLMTGAIVNFDQSVWGAYAGQAPVPDGPMTV